MEQRVQFRGGRAGAGPLVVTAASTDSVPGGLPGEQDPGVDGVPDTTRKTGIGVGAGPGRVTSISATPVPAAISAWAAACGETLGRPAAAHRSRASSTSRYASAAAAGGVRTAGECMSR